MASILELVQDREVFRCGAAEVLIRQGGTGDRLYFLIEGSVEILKDDVPVAIASQPGAVFGEMSVLLNSPNTATVRTMTPSVFHVVENPREFMAASPAVCLHVSELLARRLDALNNYLVDVRNQFEGHDHIGMVDQVLASLMHRPPRPRARPSESTLRHGEATD